MSERRKKLLQVAKETKEALFKEWEVNEYFTDNNNFAGTEKGLLSEAMGLTATMLMRVAFRGEETLFPDGAEDPQLMQIITSALNYIYDEIGENGYTVAPLRSPEDTKELFNLECSYIDTLTWVLSASALVVYAVRKQGLKLEEQLWDKVIAMLADSLARILDGQLDCGAWGFSTDPGCEPSLYFTFTVATSLADFLDYIMGELEYYSKENQKQATRKPLSKCCDWDVIHAINAYYMANRKPYFPEEELTQAVEKARAAMQNWLLKNCLPLLPKIAACIPLTDEEREMIGVVRQTRQTNIKAWDNKDFLQLYYAYYIIDILTTSSSDKRFKKIVDGEDQEITVKALWSAYEDKISATDLDYFFGTAGKSDKVKNLYRDYVDQAVHAVRYNHTVASRTGESFWKGAASELIIPWKHKTLSSGDIEQYRSKAKRDPFTEPALIPMALRANTIYCYYIIEQADITVDNLFEDITKDRSIDSGKAHEGDGTVVQNLWDVFGYNLAITERAIEAIVDYKDYLDDNEGRAAEIAAGSAAISSVDIAIENKITAYLQSEKGAEVIRSLGYAHGAESGAVHLGEDTINQLVEQRVNAILDSCLEEKIQEKLSVAGVESGNAVANTDPAMVRNQIFALINDMGYWLAANPDKLPQEGASDTVESLLGSLFAVWEAMDQQVDRKRVLEQIQRCGKCDEDEATRIWRETLSMQLEELFGVIIAGCETNSGNVASIYRRLLGN